MTRVLRAGALALVCSLGAAMGAGAAQAPGPARLDTLRVALAAAGGDDVALGVRLGIEESRHTGALLGLVVELAADTGDSRLAALIGGNDDAACRKLADAAARRGIPYLNTGCGAADLRDTSRYPAAFHVAALDSAGAAGALWRPSLTRYGAAQLNERFTERFQRPMTSGAWAGWMAVKIMAETALRARTAEPRVVVARLRMPRTRFDGHKGVPLVFDAGHQLVQPTYAGAPTGEER